MMTSKIYTTICLLLLSTTVFAQTVLNGKITDAETAEELIGATVILNQNGVTIYGVSTDFDGNYSMSVDPGTYDIEVSYIGFPEYKISSVVVHAGKVNTLNVSLGGAEILMDVVVVIGDSKRRSRKSKSRKANSVSSQSSHKLSSSNQSRIPKSESFKELAAQTVGLSSADKGAQINVRGSRTNQTDYYVDGVRVPGKTMPTPNVSEIPAPTNESYSEIEENPFKNVDTEPLSTFSVDVDVASYSNIRRYINSGMLPPKDAVRIEEMINYFNYDYPQPKDDRPFSIHSELAQCPWNNENLLLHVGLQGKEISTSQLPPSNIVFLLDVSGSMSHPKKLPLLKASLKLLVKQLRAKDKVAIVVYAGSSGLVLPSTPGNNDEKIVEALDRLSAGGGTGGKAGLELAYKVAVENFIETGNNRIVLATDGDFNIGPSSDAEMKKLIEVNREKGVFISVLGFGMGNYKDSKMEIIADNGNGNYAYIDNIDEAKKVLVNEFGGTMHTIAKDVKFQLEFNPAEVAEYRLIGYVNRLLQKKDFDNDKKDAGDIGAGHNVTALYEIKRAKKTTTENKLKYQKSVLTAEAMESNDLITLKLRYKKPNGTKSILIEQAIKNESVVIQQTTHNFNFSVAVAQFGMLLRGSKYKGNTTWKSAIDFAKYSKGPDKNGYRAEMITLMEKAKKIKI